MKEASAVVHRETGGACLDGEDRMEKATMGRTENRVAIKQPGETIKGVGGRHTKDLVVLLVAIRLDSERS